MLEDRRIHERTRASCKIVVDVDTGVVKGNTRNISIGGVLARMNEGDISILSDGTEANCVIYYGHRQCEFRLKILRVAGMDLAATFLNVDFEQDLFLRTLLENFG